MKVEDQVRSALHEDATRYSGNPQGPEQAMRLGARRRTQKQVALSAMGTLVVAGFVWFAASIPGNDGSDAAGGTDVPAVSTTLETVPPSTAAPTTPSTTVPSTSATTEPELATTTIPVAGQTVQVAFASGDGSDCSTVDFTDRIVAETDDPILGAFQHLVGGPTATEVAGGLGSMFSPATEGSVLSAKVTNGLLVVDFTDIRADMNNASTSCGSAALLAQLNATAFQFPEVDRVRYEIEGDCDTFFYWLQGECQTFSR